MLVYTRGGDNRDTNPLKYNALAQVDRAVAFGARRGRGSNPLGISEQFTVICIVVETVLKYAPLVE